MYYGNSYTFWVHFKLLIQGLHQEIALFFMKKKEKICNMELLSGHLCISHYFYMKI